MKKNNTILNGTVGKIRFDKDGEINEFMVLKHNGLILVEMNDIDWGYHLKINLDEIETVEYKTENGTRYKYITFKKESK